MFNVGDLVYQTFAKDFGLGVVVEMNNRAIKNGQTVYAYRVQFCGSSLWCRCQDLELVSEAKTSEL